MLQKFFKITGESYWRVIGELHKAVKFVSLLTVSQGKKKNSS